MTKIRNFATLQAAQDQMETDELAFVNAAGAHTLVFKNSASGFEYFANSTADLTAILAASGFSSMTDLVQKEATLRDHAITDL